jgi:hypothetical protein
MPTNLPERRKEPPGPIVWAIVLALFLGTVTLIVASKNPTFQLTAQADKPRVSESE